MSPSYSSIITPSCSLITKLALLIVSVLIIFLSSLCCPEVAFGESNGPNLAQTKRCIKFLKLTVSITDSVIASVKMKSRKLRYGIKFLIGWLTKAHLVENDHGWRAVRHSRLLCQYLILVPLLLVNHDTRALEVCACSNHGSGLGGCFFTQGLILVYQLAQVLLVLHLWSVPFEWA